MSCGQALVTRTARPCPGNPSSLATCNFFTPGPPDAECHRDSESVCWVVDADSHGRGVIAMDEISPRHRSKSRLLGLLGFWTRYRAKQDEKMIEALSNPDERRDDQAARAEKLASEREAASERFRQW